MIGVVVGAINPNPRTSTLALFLIVLIHHPNSSR
jgi:hypothetical protein